MEDKAREIDPFEQGQITEQIPAWELWEDGIEPADEAPVLYDREKAA